MLTFFGCELQLVRERTPGERIRFLVDDTAVLSVTPVVARELADELVKLADEIEKPEEAEAQPVIVNLTINCNDNADYIAKAVREALIAADRKRGGRGLQ